ncbi:MAG: ceramidase domain-containing protein [Pseudobdellovibrio sp.]
MNSRNITFATVILICATFFVCWAKLPSADPFTYFLFADDRNLFGIPNSLDVVSNFAFFLVGVLGIRNVFKTRRLHSKVIFSFGIILSIASLLVAIGSAYFHLNPNPVSLIWDRLPMTLGFATIAAMVITDRVDPQMGVWIFSILLPIGLLSVIGYGNSWVTLKLYIAFQTGTIAFLALAIIFLKQQNLPNSLLRASVILYVIAKITEKLDRNIFNIATFISGHTLKHLFAAAAIYIILSFYKSKNSPDVII